MTNNATGSGMGTAGTGSGPLMTWQVMTQSRGGERSCCGKIILIQFVLPAAVTLLISEFMRKEKVDPLQGDMKLEL